MDLARFLAVRLMDDYIIRDNTSHPASDLHVEELRDKIAELVEEWEILHGRRG